MITLPFYKTGKINKALSEINKIEKKLDEQNYILQEYIQKKL